MKGAALLPLLLVIQLSLISAEPSYDRGLQAYNEKDYVAAAKEWNAAAQRGSAPAQNALGFLFQRGLGVAKKEETAVSWFRAAASTGYGPAEYNLGLAYRQGSGVPKSPADAAKWLKLAASHGVAEAELSLGNIAYSSDPPDERSALRYWRLAAEHGNGVAAANAGFLYAEGRGVPQDLAEAAKWYAMGAKRGNSQAQHALGLLYRDGKGVRPDPVAAAKWLSLAASSSDESKTAADNLLRELSPEQASRVRQSIANWRPSEPSNWPGPQHRMFVGRDIPVGFHTVGDTGAPVGWAGDTATGVLVGKQGNVLTTLSARGCSTWRMRTESGTSDLHLVAADETQHLTALGVQAARSAGLPLRTSGDSSDDEKVFNVGFQITGLQAIRNAVRGTIERQNGEAVRLVPSQKPPNQGGPVLDSNGAVLGLALPALSAKPVSVVGAHYIVSFLNSHQIPFVVGTGPGVEVARNSVVLIECKP